MSNAQLPPLDDMMPERKFGISDIYYTLFRHKWKIFLCVLLGFVAAGSYYLTRTDFYKSDAKLFIRYVVSDANAIGAGDDTARGSVQINRGKNVIGSESQILISMDLCRRVAEIFGPEKILAGYQAEDLTDTATAAAMIRYGLSVETPTNDGIIQVFFTHPDPTIVQLVLRVVIEQYMKKHVEVHSAVGAVGNFLARETDQLRVRLAQTEAELRQAKRSAGILNSVEETKTSLSADISRFSQAIFEANSELAQRQTIFEAMTDTPVPEEEVAATEPAAPKPEIPAEKIEAMRRILGRIAILERMEQELLTKYTSENTQVKDVQAQLTEAKGTRQSILAEYPDMLKTETTLAAAPPTQTQSQFDPKLAAGEIKALQRKIEVMNQQLQSRIEQAERVNEVEGTIQDLTRKRDMEDSNYRNYVASLEESRIESTLGTGALPNISQIQTPSAPYLDESEHTIRAGILALGGIALGLGWAFALELFLDPRVRRPEEVESRIGIPFFLALPPVGTLTLRRERRKRRAERKRLAKANPEGAGPLAVADADISALNPFYETLRDRLLHYFESREVEHKPKLIAVTAIDHKAGVSSIASGLSRSLSYSEEGNVLLVDLTGSSGTARQFIQGEEVPNLDSLMQGEKTSEISDKLFMVTEQGNSAELSRHLPARFNKLVPWLKTSDFDYIIFDMPPVSQISITPRLAGFMDMVLLVLESEKTEREMAKKAGKLLRVSQSNIAAVLNKTRTYVPKALHREFTLTH